MEKSIQPPFVADSNTVIITIIFHHLKLNAYSTPVGYNHNQPPTDTMRATSSRALMSALLATTYLLSICPEFAYGSTQVVYIENDESDPASSLDERSHLRTVTAGDDSHRRHLSFWGGLLSKFSLS
jgi:hypothetical protein